MDTPSGHVTRDYREGDAALGDLRFRAVDTSGLEPFMGASTLQGRAAALTARVVASADAAVLVLDARAGVTPADAALAAWLRTAVQGPGLVVAAVNKAERARETPAVAAAVAEAGGLGFGEAVGLSAETGEGMADLYTALQPLVDAAVAARGAVEAGRAHASDPSPSPPATVITAAPAAAPTTIRLAIVGLPNAGKSTLVNRLLGTPRSLTGPEPGLTRDAVRASFDWQGRRVEVIDTAGWVRRAAAAGGRVPGGGVLVDVPGACRGGGGATTRAQATNPAVPHPVSVGSAGPGAVALALEAQAQAERGVDVAHCVVLVTDAAGGWGGGAGSGPGVQAGSTLARSQPPPPVLTRAEVAIASATVTEGRALVFVANKVDLLGSPGAAAAAAARLARDAAARVPDAAGAPCLAMSAETGAGVDALMPAIAAVHDAWTRRVPTSRLNAWLADTVRDLEQGGGGGGGRNRGSPAARDVARVRYVTQASTRPPAFVAFVRGGVADLAPTTVRMLKKRLSSTFGFEGVPLRVFVRGRPSGSGGGRGGQTRRQPGRMRRGGS
jgi:predicted GTPase